ncbi:MAG: MarR family transcriptional regulator [Candidatus Omnitrophota bacterium]
MVTIKEIVDEIAVMLPKLMKNVNTNLLTKIKLTQAQMTILVSIREHGRCRLNKLAKERNISPPTATGLIDRLARSGYVRRGSDPEDRRACIVSLTKKGETSVEYFLDTVREVWKDLLLCLTPKEQEAYLNILKKIVLNLSKKDIK